MGSLENSLVVGSMGSMVSINLMKPMVVGAPDKKHLGVRGVQAPHTPTSTTVLEVFSHTLHHDHTGLLALWPHAHESQLPCMSFEFSRLTILIISLFLPLL